MEENNWYKENDYKIILKDYLWKKDRNTWHLQPNNLPPEIGIDTLSGRENLKGKKINNIEILYPCGYNADRRVMYVCKCFCGNYFLASGKNIKNKNTKSCNCLHRNKLIKRNLENGKDIIGTKQGLLFIESIAGLKNTADPDHKELMVNCICDCGRRCVKQAVYIRNGETRSCGFCNNHSIGERLIADFLDKNCINYKHEYSFTDLKTENGFLMRFDFAIFSNEDKLLFLLEYDGEQHYKETNFFKNSLENIKMRDKMKEEYCLKNNIKLIRISYKENINEKLEEIFNEL